jgi:hypothetical protein
VLPTAAKPSGEGVLDHETGLVWQRVPSVTTFSYGDADYWCRTTKIGERYGWRLPLASEIMTLIDDTQTDSLPPGHPFTITTDVYYWTQTPDATNAQFQQTVTFLQGGDAVSVEARPRDGNSGAQPRAFCVRGNGDSGEPQAADEMPAWSRKLDATGGCHSARFQCVLPTATYFDGAAVLDRETGLVWERKPATATDSWSNVLSRCDERPHAGAMGWRLPSSNELASLVDGNIGPGSTALPPGHPFDLSGGGTSFWTTSQYGGDGLHEVVYFQSVNSGTPGFVYVYAQGGSDYRYWCVRAGGGEGASLNP